MTNEAGGFQIAVNQPSYLDTLENDGERRCFDYFRNRTASQLAGYFSSEFWDCLVPLSTHYHPAIKHAVIALASLHERYEKNDSSILGPNHDTSQGGFALQHYIRAINHLTGVGTFQNEQSIDAYLLASILFACFEVWSSLRLRKATEKNWLFTISQTLRGHFGSALSHIHSGVKLFAAIDEKGTCQTAQRDVSSQCVPLAPLKLVIAKLDFQSYQVGLPIDLLRRIRS